MSTQPTRCRIEPGVYERVGADGQRLGLEIAWKDAAGKARRRTVRGGVQDARDALAQARSRRVKREAEPADPRVSLDTVADEFERSHVTALRHNSQAVYRAALRPLRAALGHRRMSAIAKVDVRAFVAAERAEGPKAWTIASHVAVLSALFAFARDDLDMPVSMPRLKPSERPRPADDARERRILTDDELARVLDASGERERSYFRTLAETGARMCEVLGLTRRRIDADMVTFAEQLGRGGELAPLKTRTSRRTIEVTRSLAVALALQGERVFGHLTHASVDHAWRRALKRAGVADPQPTIHDLRHTHVSGLIADGWDPVEIAARIGDTLATTLAVYSHEFDIRRRGEQRRKALEARYDAGMATDRPQQSATAPIGRTAEVADLQAVRDGRR